MTTPNSNLIDVLVRLCWIPSAVPLGEETLIAPDDPILVDYVQRGLRPELEAIPGVDLVDLPRNQIAVRAGNGNGPTLLLMAYTPTQHNNLMADPWSGAIRIPSDQGIHEPCIFGQGVSQNKAHQAVLVDTARRLANRFNDINGTVWLCFNNEGRSSHDCTYAILDALPDKPDFAMELFPTDFRISLGNRGRADIYVHVIGLPAHSSHPELGLSAIDGAAEVVERVRALDARIDRVDPFLGREGTCVYQVRYSPLAPHTLPGYARLTVDRRLLPGTDPDVATAQLDEALSDIAPWEIRVERGVTMLPVKTDPSLPELDPLRTAASAVLGHPAEEYAYPGTFDAGGPASRGIPTVMFGLNDEGDLLGDDFVRVSAVEQEAAIVHEFIVRFFSDCGSGLRTG